MSLAVSGSVARCELRTETQDSTRCFYYKLLVASTTVHAHHARLKGSLSWSLSLNQAEHFLPKAIVPSKQTAKANDESHLGRGTDQTLCDTFKAISAIRVSSPTCQKPFCSGSICQTTSTQPLPVFAWADHRSRKRLPFQDAPKFLHFDLTIFNII